MGEVVEIDANKTKALAFLEDMTEKLRANELTAFAMVGIVDGEDEIQVKRYYASLEASALLMLIGAGEIVQDELKRLAQHELEVDG